MVAGVRGSWSLYVHSQEAEIGRMLVWFWSRAPGHGMVPLTSPLCLIGDSKSSHVGNED